VLVEQALQKLLRTDAGVSALGARIYPNQLPQTPISYPAAAVRLVSREHMGRRLERRGASGLARSRYRIFSTAEGTGGYAQAKRLDEAIRLCLDGFAGTVTDETVSPQETVEIQGIEVLTSLDFYDDKTATHQVATDFDVWADEQQPTP
jgi:hypothetical protein